MRRCGAFGIQNVHTIEILCDFKPNGNIVKGTDKWIELHRYSGDNATVELVNKLRSEGYRIVSTSPHKNGISCEDFDVEKGKAAIFFGTEKTGISEVLEEMSDEFITIPMYGFVESLNISVCAAIILQSIAKKLHSSNVNWQIPQRERDVLLNRWMRYSVKDSERILNRKFNK